MVRARTYLKYTHFWKVLYRLFLSFCSSVCFTFCALLTRRMLRTKCWRWCTAEGNVGAWPLPPQIQTHPSSLSYGTWPDTGMTIELSSPPLLARRVDPFPDHKILCLFLCSGTSRKAYPAKIKRNIYYQFSHLTGSLGEQDLAQVLQRETGRTVFLGSHELLHQLSCQV